MAPHFCELCASCIQFCEFLWHSITHPLVYSIIDHFLFALLLYSSLQGLDMNTKATLLGNDAIQAGIKAGNINTVGSMATYSMDLSAESQEAQVQHAETLRRYEAQQRARSMVVPTAVEDVKQKLRELGHVVTFFGENHADRRERLREVVARLELDEEEAAEMQVNILLIICLYDCVTCLSVWSSDLL
jgi:sorbitol-specific phosphotransferase system component IIA